MASKNVKDAIQTNEIVPDVISKAPTKLINVFYENGLSVNLGNELTPTQVQNQPIVEFERESGKFYTLIMTDPDARSRREPSLREVLHWQVVNIPGDTEDVDGAETLFAYVGSGPPKESGLHRYIFLLYEQTRKLDFSGVPNNGRESRIKFSTENFTKQFNLGDPIAANFYEAQYDDYVPILHSKHK